MNEQQLAAVKQALEALESERDKYLEWGDEDGAPEDVYEAITALQSIISQDALHKMAEESRTSGLSYNDWDKIGCVNHDCDQCKAVQEPVAWREFDGEGGYTYFAYENNETWRDDYIERNGEKYADWVEPLYTTPPAAPVQEPVIDHSCKDTYELIMKWADIYAAQTGELYSQAAQDPSKAARMADERTMLACVVAQAFPSPAAQRQWVGLTNEERLTEAARHFGEMHIENCGLGNIKDFARALEAKIKEKNT
jgi:hypothetical protein